MNISKFEKLIQDEKTKEVVMCGTKFTKQTKVPAKFPDKIEELKIKAA